MFFLALPVLRENVGVRVFGIDDFRFEICDCRTLTLALLRSREGVAGYADRASASGGGSIASACSGGSGFEK